MIRDKIREDMIAALKAKEELRLSVLRGLIAAFTNELVAQKRKPDEELSDDDALKVIKRSSKQRQDSIDQFTKGGRSELADIESAELKILESYLPESMTREDILKIAKSKKAELNIDDKAKFGVLIGAVMKETKGKADGAEVKEVLESLF
jgi:uncharacterized protein